LIAIIAKITPIDSNPSKKCDVYQGKIKKQTPERSLFGGA
jgi:hypothetical protein